MRQRRHAALLARERGPENAGAAPALPQGRSHGHDPDARNRIPAVMQLQYTGRMKTSTLPAVRVEPALREQVEQVLQEGETLSAFVEASVRETVRHRLEQSAFVARGMASLEAARQGGHYVEARATLDKLQARLDRARPKGRRATSGRR